MSSSPSVADPDSSRIPLRFALVPARSAVLAFLSVAVPIFVFLLPLLVWPGLAQPFSSPKLLAWVGVTVLFGGALLAARGLRAAEVPAAAVLSLALLTACVGLSAATGTSADVESLLLVLTALAWFALLARAEIPAASLSIALAGAASVIAVVSLLQFAGADPFQLAGWTGVGGASPRMRVYATLGNPNFVGAFLAGILPLTVAMALRAPRTRRFLALAVLLQGVALVATGSRAAAVGAVVACGLVLAQFAKSRKWLGLALCLFVALPVLGLTAARSLPETLQGRLYVWRVAMPHLSSIPVFGFGPGAFEEKFNQWQQDYFRAGVLPADRRFAAPFDHAHNDFLEWTVEYGWAGLGALAGCLFLFLRFARRSASPISQAALAGACGLALIALADFPFHRPEGLFLVATLTAMACAGSEMRWSGPKETQL